MAKATVTTENILRIETLAAARQSPVAGRFYLVPCVRLHNAWVPVIDNLHTDKEIAPGIGRHYHLDWRFVGEWLARNVFLLPLRDDRNPPTKCFAKIHDIDDEQGPYDPPVWKRKRCIRGSVTFPLHFPPLIATDYFTPNCRRVQILTLQVEDLCAGQRIDPANPVCAHRGIPLGDIAPDADGCVTCPGHGLRWNLSTGEMVPRYSAAEEKEARNRAQTNQTVKNIVKVPILSGPPEAAHV